MSRGEVLAAVIQAEKASAVASFVAGLKVEGVEEFRIGGVSDESGRAAADRGDDISDELVLSIEKHADGDGVRLDLVIVGLELGMLGRQLRQLVDHLGKLLDRVGSHESSPVVGDGPSEFSGGGAV